MEVQKSFLSTDFLCRFSVKRIYLPLFGALLVGVTTGAMLAAGLEEFRASGALRVLLFSGIPNPDTGFLSCFSTILLNLLSCLIVLFLLGVTAFGGVGVPLFLFFRSVALGVGAMSFLAAQSAGGLRYSALCYLPAAAGSSLLLLLFGTRAFAFSNNLMKAGFSGSQECLDFHFYFKDFLAFVCFAVVVTLASSVLAMTVTVLF